MSAVSPAIPNFTLTQSKQIAKWILSNTHVRNKDLLHVVTGNIKPFKPPAGSKGTYVLKASYVDHGINTLTGSNISAQKTIVLHNK
ncbi:MAG: hypothetical protein ABIR81_11850 [Ginsengibacter sp.]